MDPMGVIRQSATAADGDLVARLRNGEADAFRTLMQRHNQRLFRLARGILRDSADAEDALQDAYVLAFTRMDQFRADSSLATWLGRIVINEALRRLRQRMPMVDRDGDGSTGRGREGQVVPLFPAQQPPATPEEDAARAEIRRVLVRAIDGLPDKFRLVFILREVEQMSIREAASVLGIPEDTVKTRLHRARRMLGRSLRRQLSSDLPGMFPFAGARCARVVSHVMGRLGAQGASAGD
ncbi:MAG TPA: RNA polymerase sigma factor [Azospirillaceae bacterium]|nr:RNA polymerase sigma factor [Azospirillaceae bacterium]